MKIHKIYFQRNGVLGNSFYTAYFRHLDFGRMVATFETDNNSMLINRQTCRVISLVKPEQAFRGDDIAATLQIELRKMVEESKTIYGIYGLTENNKALEDAGHPIDTTFVLNKQTGNTETE